MIFLLCLVVCVVLGIGGLVFFTALTVRKVEAALPPAVIPAPIGTLIFGPPPAAAS